MLHPRADEDVTAAMKLGAAVDFGFFYGDEAFAEKYPDTAEFSSFQTKAAREWKAEQEARGAIVLPKDTRENAVAMVRRLRSKKHINELFNGKTQVSAFAEDPNTGLRIKGRIDGIHEGLGVAVDLKTCTDASWGKFLWQATDLAYHMQAAMYLWLLELNGIRLKKFIWVCIETGRGNAIGYYCVPDEMLELGREHVRAALDTKAALLPISKKPLARVHKRPEHARTPAFLAVETFSRSGSI